MATKLSSNDTKNYTAIPSGNTTVDRDITIDEIDTDTPLTFGNTHTFGEVFVGGLNKIIKTLIRAILGIKHRKYGTVDNIIAEDMRGQTFTLSYGASRSSLYAVTIDAEDDCRDIICKMSDGTAMHWHPFMGNNRIELFGVNGGHVTSDKFKTQIATNGRATAEVVLASISYDNNKFTVTFSTLLSNPSNSVVSTISVPLDGVGIEWEVY